MLGLDGTAFWRLTPREIQACFDAWAENQGRSEDIENQRIGTVCATIFNAQRTNKRDPVLTWLNFFKPRKQELEKPRIAPPEKIERFFESLISHGKARQKVMAESKAKREAKLNARTW